MCPDVWLSVTSVRRGTPVCTPILRGRVCVYGTPYGEGLRVKTLQYKQGPCLFSHGAAVACGRSGANRLTARKRTTARKRPHEQQVSQTA